MSGMHELMIGGFTKGRLTKGRLTKRRLTKGQLTTHATHTKNNSIINTQIHAFIDSIYHVFKSHL